MSIRTYRVVLMLMPVALAVAMLAGCSQQQSASQAPPGMAVGKPLSSAQVQAAEAASQAARAKHGNQ